jgi:transcriptional regulator with XRE-family HTH domain
MSHASRYQWHGITRLSADTGIHRTTLTRIIKGTVVPTVQSAARIAEALERDLGHRVDPRDLFAEEGRFPHRFTCDLVDGCRGCLPDIATDEFGDRKKSYEGIEPGKWVTSRYPRGYEVTKGGGNDAD